MNATPARNAPPAEGTFDIGWIVLAAVVGFALFGVLGFVGFAAIAFVLIEILGLGEG